MEHNTTAKSPRMRAGDYLIGGGVYLPNRKQDETVTALKAMISGDVLKLQYVWNSSCIEFTAEQVILGNVAAVKIKWAGVLQKVGTRLVYLPSTNFWGYLTVDALISHIESDKRRVEVEVK